MSGSAIEEYFDSLIRDVPDFPTPGVLFKDITPLLADHEALTAVIAALAEAGVDADGKTIVDKVIGTEARGFILGAPVALALGVGFVPVRKAGKLPGERYATNYELEYGQATIEMHVDALVPGDRVLLVDDVLATGGTADATRRLVDLAGASVVSLAVMLELGFLSGREFLAPVPVHALRTL